MLDTSDHIWSQEHIAAYIAHGLDAQEAERLEAHARECPACAAAVASARSLDSGLSSLFAEARPGLELEDRAIHKFRTTSHRPLLGGWVKRTVAALAAMIILGALGAFAGSLIDGGLPMPGFAARNRDAEEAAQRAQQEAAMSEQARGMDRDDMKRREGIARGEILTNEVFEFPANRESALPGIDRVNKQTVDAIITGDSLGQPNVPSTDPTLAAIIDGSSRTAGTSSYGMWYDGGTPTIGGMIDKKSGMNDEKRKELGKQVLGRSGATASTTLSSSGGSGPGAPLFGSNGPGNTNINGYYASPLYQGVGAGTTGSADTNGPAPTWTFKPSDHRVTVTKAVTETERTPVQKTVTVMEREPGARPPAAEPTVPALIISPEPDPKPAAPPDITAEPTKRVILRSGDIEFEIESFDAASATITKLVNGIKGGFIGTVNSEKLPNSKVKGSITVRVPPEFLDSLVLDLRKELGKGGTLKGLRISSQDVTKQYTDTESRLKAARTMETRLLQIIKEGKGEIKQLLEAEKELGVWRTKIEEFEGELRYYANLAALSTLTISLTEKEIRAAAALTENERVQAGVEVEDVDKAYQAVLTAVAEAKGRMTKSELKQLSAGQFNATLNFEVAPEAGGPIRDRLAQLGRVARHEIDRVTQTEGGSLPTDAKAKRGDTVFLVQLYNLANVAPRETATVQVAVVDVPVAYQAIRDAIAKANARVFAAQLDEHDRQNVTAQIDFEVRRADEAALRTALDSAGEVVARQIARAAEGENVTDAKVLYKTTLMAANRLKPRETTLLSVEVADVAQTTAAFASQVTDAKGRQVDAQSTRDRNSHMTAKVVYEVPLTAAAGLVQGFKSAGIVRSHKSTRDPNATDGKFATARIEATITSVEDVVATASVAVEVPNVDQSVIVFTSLVAEAKGRQVDGNTTSHDRNGRVTAKLEFEVPLPAAAGLVEKFKAAGTVRSYKSNRDQNATDGKYATARIEVTLTSVEDIVAPDAGLWPQVKRGLSYSASVLLTSVTWVVFGLCVVLPWALIGFAGFRVGRRLIRSGRPETPPTPPVPASA
jgi:Domain of unknown function (DUF4349)/Putative zinc-finger